MTAVVGSTLAHFEITDRLGEGGMGTVYRATDTRLGRQVAIKVLPEAFTADPERLARFEREAKLLAALNHPAIAGIYEVGEADEVHFLVMELAEGEDLAARLGRGALPIAEALPIARQIAEALEAAHAAGVVHRDLKPANVMLLPDGRVKVLDFGLAKAMGAAGGIVADLSHSPTLTARMTSAGMILGTAAYMSPEQAKGEEADRRSDIWSFGVVLWEMLVGRKTFDERTVSETLAAVLKSDPDHSVVPSSVPLAIRRLIERCLQKDPRQRLHDIADARLEIEAVLRGDASALPTTTGTAPAATGPWKTVALASAAVALVAIGLHFRPADAPATSARIPIEIALSEPQGWIDGRGPSIAISPDGTRVAYLGKPADQPFASGLFVRHLSSVEATAVPGTATALGPFFSPDGTRLGFVDIDGLQVVSLAGGPPIAVSGSISNYRGAAWADDDSIWYSPDTEAGLWRMGSDGSDPRQMTSPDASRGERSHRWPTVLPGSDVVLFTVATSRIESFDQARIDALRLSTGERKTIVEGGSFPLWLAPTTLVYAYAGTLMAVDLDVESLVARGAAVPVYDGLRTLPLSGAAMVSVSAEGSIVAGRGPVAMENRQLRRYQRSGASELVTEELRPYQGVTVSPDGTTLGLDIDAANAGAWLLDLERGVQTRLTREWSHNLPLWSPDGSRIMTSTSKGGTYYLELHDLEGGTPPQIFFASAEHQVFAWAWSADDRIVAAVLPNRGYPEIWSFPLADPDRPMVLIDGIVAWHPRLSPDGRWLAFSGTESGQTEVYVAPSDRPGRRLRVSSNGGWAPVWSQDGRELYFISGAQGSPSEAWMMATRVTVETSLQIGRPERLFPTPAIYPGSIAPYDVDAAGGFYVIDLILDRTLYVTDAVLTRHWVDLVRAKLAAG